jgi:polar amino acid transport system substrate-binding protein/cystine transport system substrate-binding protein/membrane-bound lytic murein transglycosylase F
VERARPILRDVATFVVLFGLLGAVYLLPPDTSLAEVKAAASLRVCVPPEYPPLVTGTAEKPGIDIEILQAIAKEFGVGLDLNQNPAIGRDFNPRAWRLTRAQCQVIAGAVIDSALTRSFLDVTGAYAATGWATISREPITTLADKKVGVLVAASGLDRITLSRQLRDVKAEIGVTASVDELAAGLADKTFDVGVTEAMLAGAIAAEHGWLAAWLPGSERNPLVFGLWKGDLTLKRGIGAALDGMRRDGRLKAILEKYLGPGGAALAGEAGT